MWREILTRRLTRRSAPLAREGDEPMRVVNAVARADAIMGLVASTARPLSIGSIARDLGLPRNTTYELVFTLCECRLLRMGVDGRVSPGIRLFELGGVYVASLDWVEEAREVAREVRDLSGETVQVAMLDGRDAIYLVKEESQKAIRMASSIGRRLSAHASAIGKVLLAGLPYMDLVALLGTQSLERLTEHTIVDPAQLMEEFESNAFGHRWKEQRPPLTRWRGSSASPAAVAVRYTDAPWACCRMNPLQLPAPRWKPKRAGSWARSPTRACALG